MVAVLLSPRPCPRIKPLDISRRYSSLAHGFLNGCGNVTCGQQRFVFALAVHFLLQR